MFLLFHCQKKGTSGPNNAASSGRSLRWERLARRISLLVLNENDPDNSLLFRPYSKEETNTLELTRVGSATRFRHRLSCLISSSNFFASDTAAKRLSA